MLDDSSSIERVDDHVRLRSTLRRAPPLKCQPVQISNERREPLSLSWHTEGDPLSVWCLRQRLDWWSDGPPDRTAEKTWNVYERKTSEHRRKLPICSRHTSLWSSRSRRRNRSHHSRNPRLCVDRWWLSHRSNSDEQIQNDALLIRTFTGDVGCSLGRKEMFFPVCIDSFSINAYKRRSTKVYFSRKVSTNFIGFVEFDRLFTVRIVSLREKAEIRMICLTRESIVLSYSDSGKCVPSWMG